MNACQNIRSNAVLTLGLVFLCASCAAPGGVPVSQKTLSTSEKPHSAKESAANDMACAYFYFLWGKTAENNHRYDEALEAYEKAVLCDEASEYLKHSLAVLLIRMDRKEQAVDFLENMISTNPDNTENMALLAKVYMSMGRDDEAIALYQEILQIKEDHDALLMLGTIYAKNKEYDKAQNMLNRLIKLEGGSYLAYYSLARLYRELQYNDKAIEAYQQALQLNWSERLAYELAEFYEEQKEFDKAEITYRRIIDEGESGDLAKTRLVNLYLTQGENDKALELLRELRASLPESHNIDITISRILISQEKYDEAIMVLQDVLHTNPELTILRYLLGMAYYRIGENQKAVEQLQFIPPESSLFEDSIFLQVRMLSDNDNLQAAIELLEKQIENAASRKPGFYILLASLYRENGAVAKGRDTFEQARRIYPDDIDLLYNYGIFLEKAGEQEDAMAIMQEVLDQEPDNGAALNYVGYTWADNNINLEKALEYVKRAVALLPDDGYVRDSLGWVYYKQGNFTQAVIELEKASEMVEDDPIIQEHLGDAYIRTKQYEKGVAAYEKSYKLYKEQEKKDKVSAKIEAVISGSVR